MKRSSRLNGAAAVALRSCLPDANTSYARPPDSAREREPENPRKTELASPRSWPRYIEFEGQIVDIDHTVFEDGWIADAEVRHD